eukprot:Anaeramoba_ignava/c20844_g1_i1.p1 GENE.c20844_g1_i1~~c20844_g1_i1.p1  ORF type:complete len:443 (+),score=142.34 c20844_g1_i1:37-1329(+)
MTEQIVSEDFEWISSLIHENINLNLTEKKLWLRLCKAAQIFAPEILVNLSKSTEKNKHTFISVCEKMGVSKKMLTIKKRKDLIPLINALYEKLYMSHKIQTNIKLTAEILSSTFQKIGLAEIFIHNGTLTISSLSQSESEKCDLNIQIDAHKQNSNILRIIFPSGTYFIAKFPPKMADTFYQTFKAAQFIYSKGRMYPRKKFLPSNPLDDQFEEIEPDLQYQIQTRNKKTKDKKKPLKQPQKAANEQEEFSKTRDVELFNENKFRIDLIDQDQQYFKGLIHLQKNEMQIKLSRKIYHSKYNRLLRIYYDANTKTIFKILLNHHEFLVQFRNEILAHKFLICYQNFRNSYIREARTRINEKKSKSVSQLMNYKTTETDSTESRTDWDRSQNIQRNVTSQIIPSVNYTQQNEELNFDDFFADPKRAINPNGR